MQAHKRFANTARALAQEACGDSLRLFERHAGLLYTRNGVPIAVTIPGMADLYGWVRTPAGAVPVEIELKVGRDRLRPEQVAWAEMCASMGVWYRMARADGPDDIARASTLLAAELLELSDV